MKQLIICQGLPGSGKSTWVKSQVELFPYTTKRVNRDDLRAMIDPLWSKSNETFIRKIRDNIIVEGLNNGHCVIVDDTNLSPNVVNELVSIANTCNAPVTFKSFLHVTLEECIKRDAKRANPVGEQVIKKMYYQFLYKKPEPIVYNPLLPNAVICDLDGTLALFEGKRNAYDASKCDETDEANITVLELLHFLVNQNYIILFTSGRSEKYLVPTLKFLENKCGFLKASFDDKLNYLFMREISDNRDDTIVKREMYEENIKDKFNVKFILDDRPKVVRTWQALGFTVFNVGNGVEF